MRVIGGAFDATVTPTEATALLDLRTDAAKGLMPARMGRWASLSSTVTIANTLTRVVGGTLASDLLQVGTSIRIRAMGVMSNTTGASSTVFTVRIAGASLNTPIVASWTVALGTTARTNRPFILDAEIIILSTGATGTAIGQIVVNLTGTPALATPTSVITSPVTIATNATREIELACISGAATTTWTFHTASIEFVQP